jgi:UPF0271 protein
MVTEGKILTVDGVDIASRADTICIHGDGPDAAAYARAIREGLEGAGVTVRALG